MHHIVQIKDKALKKEICFGAQLAQTNKSNYYHTVYTKEYAYNYVLYCNESN